MVAEVRSIQASCAAPSGGTSVVAVRSQPTNSACPKVLPVRSAPASRQREKSNGIAVTSRQVKSTNDRSEPLGTFHPPGAVKLQAGLVRAACQGARYGPALPMLVATTAPLPSPVPRFTRAYQSWSAGFCHQKVRLGPSW